MDHYGYKLCKHWVKNNTCHYGHECKFSHGQKDITNVGILISKMNIKPYQEKHVKQKHVLNASAKVFYTRQEIREQDFLWNKRFTELYKRNEPVSLMCFQPKYGELVYNLN
jgi:hypothetical protein